jgi:ubiquinone/menaquinone biosynthesis C-methylase UbiE
MMRVEEKISLNMKKTFNTLFKWEKSESFRDIWREVYGDDYPEEVNHDGAVTMTDLRNIVKIFNVGPGDTFIDMGCGRGGPGLWVARELGANYLGFDLSERAVEVAAKRAINFGLENKATFKIGNIHETNFPDNYFDGALSIDALTFVPNQLKALCEILRILRSGALFVFTSFEQKDPRPGKDYGSLLNKAGFEVKLYEETPDWNRRQREVYERVLENKEILIKDMGKEGASLWILEAKGFLPTLKFSKRILAVGMKVH